MLYENSNQNSEECFINPELKGESGLVALISKTMVNLNHRESIINHRDHLILQSTIVSFNF